MPPKTPASNQPRPPVSSYDPARRPRKSRTYHLLGLPTRNPGGPNKILDAVLRGTSDANIAFAGLRSLLLRLGFQERVRGSHHIFWKEDVAEILNLQPKGSKAKPYQVKQVRGVLLKYELGGEPDAEV